MLAGRMAFSVALMVAALPTACTQATSDEQDEAIQSTAEALVSDNSVTLQGVMLQGVELQGVELQGVELQGVELQGVELQGVELQGTMLTGTLNGSTVSGADLVGSTMVGALSNGDDLQMRIDAIDPSTDAEVSLYTVSYLAGATWTSLCGTSYGVPVRAVALQGRWDTSRGTPTGGDFIADPTMITFGCSNAVAAKCIMLGYKPWKVVNECKKGSTCTSRSLREVHQACTRMMRADYCGDGMPHTKNGTSINLWDTFSIQQRSTANPEWKQESEWTTDGAACLETFRWNIDDVTKNYVEDHCPEKATPGDGDCFDSSSTFFTKHGYSVPMSTRSLLRNENLSDGHYGDALGGG